MPMMRPVVPTPTSDQTACSRSRHAISEVSNIEVTNIGPGRKILFTNSKIGATTAARPNPIEP
jgi:hypothetical protein